MKNINIDPYTSAVSPIDMYFDNTPLSRGTAFFWEEEGQTFLVTNWHNFSGKDPFTGNHITENAAEPNRITFDVFEGGDLNKRRTLSTDLFENYIPTWLEHPMHKSRVDVVCRKIALSGHSVFPINTLASQQIVTKIGHDVFILGYPMGIDTLRLPVWKRGSVASEPDIDVSDLPMFYVDTATASGMSGSPVIRRDTSGEMENGEFVIGGRIMSRFVGVYSGRITTKDAHEAQLGIVWKSRVIPEIISGGTPRPASATAAPPPRHPGRRA